MGKTGVGQKEEELPVKYLKRKSFNYNILQATFSPLYIPGAQFHFVRFLKNFVQKHWEINVVNSSLIVNVCEVQLIF